MKECGTTHNNRQCSSLLDI